MGTAVAPGWGRWNGDKGVPVSPVGTLDGDMVAPGHIGRVRLSWGHQVGQKDGWDEGQG